MTAVAIAKGATASTSTLTLIKGALKIMAWTKAKTAIVSSAVVLLAAGTTTITVKEIQEHRTYPWQVENADFKLLQRFKTNSPGTQAKIVPTKFPRAEGRKLVAGDLLGIAQPVEAILSAAYGGSPGRTILPAGLPRENTTTLPWPSGRRIRRRPCRGKRKGSSAWWGGVKRGRPM